MEEIILAVLLSLPVHTYDRSEKEQHRQERLAIAANAIWEASADRPNGVSRTQMISAIAATAWSESAFAAYVGEGRCHEGPIGARCDEDERGWARARSYWQVWMGACPSAWRAANGSKEEVVEAAKCAAHILVARWNECQSGWHGAFSRYASRSCNWSQANDRMSLMNTFQSRLLTMSNSSSSRNDAD